MLGQQRLIGRIPTPEREEGDPSDREVELGAHEAVRPVAIGGEWVPEHHCRAGLARAADEDEPTARR